MRCGTFDWQWTDPDTAEPVRTWEADIDLCLGCHRLDTVSDRMRASKASNNGQRPMLFALNAVEARADG